MSDNEELTYIGDIDLRHLAEIYDVGPSFLSIYLPRSSLDESRRNEPFVRNRMRSIGKVLDRDALSIIEKALDYAMDAISSDPVDGEKGLVIFASVPGKVFHVFRIPAVPERRLVVDTSPYLLPLASLRDEFEPYGIVLVDSQSAELVLVRSTSCTEMGGISQDLMNKHKRGGMSQRRFQRGRDGAIDKFLKRVAEDMERFNEVDRLRGIIIAGPGEVKKQLLDLLPAALKEKVLSLMDLQMGASCGEMMEDADRIAYDDERRKGEAQRERFRDELLKGEGAVFGPDEVKEALEAGRVDTLIILEGTRISGWLCESCQNLNAGTKVPAKCPRCEGPVSLVDYVEELYELAKRSGAMVEFVKVAPYIESLGGIGAILRY